MTAQELKYALDKVKGISDVALLTEQGDYAFLSGLFIDGFSKNLFLYCAPNDSGNADIKIMRSARLNDILDNVPRYFNVFVKLFVVDKETPAYELKDVQFRFNDDVVVLITRWRSA